jgi:cytochrome b involved in lipid metabolism
LVVASWDLGERGAGGRSKRRARSIKINMSNNKVLTLEEVSKHNTKDDCWLIIGGKVFSLFSSLLFSFD